uniref:Endonuclease/exonuclease/phosphatase domain-containing protein n=1 Tax=Oryza nivara TaxID=4536 RepID=A0A0E0GMM1_ORYNI
MASTVRRAFRCLLDGLRSLPPRRRRAGAGGGAARRSSKAAPRVVVIRRFSGKLDRRRASASGGPPTPPAAAAAAPVTIRVATFNAAMFSMAPAVPSPPDHDDYDGDGEGCSTWRAPASSSSGSRLARRPKKGILKAQSRSSAPPPPPSPDVELLRRRRHVSISLPDDDDEIAPHHRRNSSSSSSSASARLVTRPAAATSGSGRWRSVFGAVWEHQNHYQQRRQKQKQKQEREQATARHRSSSGAARRRSVAEALREAGADMVALQNVRAEEGRGMRPLSELAEGLGMRYVFAESWAPEYGNAVLSRWPIKRWNARRLADHFDFRNVMRATIEVPGAGEVNLYCTHLDHLDEGLRMKQYHEEIGKPPPKSEVMRHLKAKRYVDAKDFAGGRDAGLVVVPNGQDVQGTCKYGTRVDYILASPNSPYSFVPGSYAVVPSMGTSDHHIVMVDVAVAAHDGGGGGGAARRRRRRRVVKVTNKSSARGIFAD